MAWGGKRKGAGRKPGDKATDLRQFTVNLPENMWEFIREQKGNGLSEKLRGVVRQCMCPTPTPAATKKYTPFTALPDEEKEAARAAEKRRQALHKRGYYEEGGEYLSTENLHMSLNTLRKLKEEFGPAR